MKWPKSVMFIRHDTSAYNVLRDKKRKDPDYAQFLREWKKNPFSPTTVDPAHKIKAKFALGVSDANTPLADPDGRQAFETGVKLKAEWRETGEIPDVIYVSPYLRALRTLERIKDGWPEIRNVQTIEDERIIEQDHGLALLYNDWRVFETIHPEQHELRKMLGPYRYRYPQGENVLDVRNRNRLWINTLVREHSNQRVQVVNHHLNILATRANFERFGEARFIHLDENEKPINCGVTLYRGYPDEGKDGHLKLEYYNKKLYGKN